MAEALLAVSGVEAADVDWESGTAVVSHAAGTVAGSLKEVVESAAHGTHHDYKVLRVESRDGPGGTESNA